MDQSEQADVQGEEIRSDLRTSKAVRKYQDGTYGCDPSKKIS